MRKDRTPRPIEGLPLFPAQPKKTDEEIILEDIARAGRTAADYTPYDKWYYLLGGRVLSVDEIEPKETRLEEYPKDWNWPFLRKLPKDPKRRRRVMEEFINSSERQLAERIAWYEDLLARGEDAMDPINKRLFGADIPGCLAAACCHISAFKGDIKIVKEMLEGENVDLRKKG